MISQCRHMFDDCEEKTNTRQNRCTSKANIHVETTQGYREQYLGELHFEDICRREKSKRRT